MTSNVRGGSNDATLPNISTDDVGGVQYQRVKLDVGGTGLSVPVVGALPVSGTVTTTPPSNASSNVAQVGGTATDTNSGTKSAGTLRIVIATDQPALTNALKVDGSAVTQPVSGTVTANAGTGTMTTGERGAANVATGQVTPTASAATLLASRATRKTVTLYNGTNVTVYIGPATVTTANGFALLPGAGLTIPTTALLQNIVSSVTGLTGVVNYVESYD